MPTTFKIGSVDFPAMSESDGRKAIQMDVDSAVYPLRRFAPSGTSGNLVIRSVGKHGGKILALFMYIGTVATADALFKADKDAWKNTAVTIVDDAGVPYEKCNLNPGTMRRVTKPEGTGSLKLKFNVQAEFTQDGP
jgi:hypothetical protein